MHLKNIDNDFLKGKLSKLEFFKKLEEAKKDLKRIGKEISKINLSASFTEDNQLNLQKNTQYLEEKLYKKTEIYSLLHRMRSLLHLDNFFSDKKDFNKEIIKSAENELSSIVFELKEIGYLNESEAKLFMDDIEKKIKEYKKDKEVL
ncbi:MAG: hypothetical protein WCX79_03395 [Candidatus Paceibacterota bacterium]